MYETLQEQNKQLKDSVSNEKLQREKLTKEMQQIAMKLVKYEVVSKATVAKIKSIQDSNMKYKQQTRNYLSTIDRLEKDNLELQDKLDKKASGANSIFRSMVKGVPDEQPKKKMPVIEVEPSKGQKIEGK